MTLNLNRLEKKVRIAVVGDVMLDRYWHGPTTRISPEAPVPVIKVNHKEERPGGAANVALNIAALGAEVSLLGIVGYDAAADSLREKLSCANVNCLFITHPLAPTITKLRIMSQHQQLMRLDFEEQLSDFGDNHLASKLLEIIDTIDALVLSDYAKGTLIHAQSLIGLAKERAIPVLVDPKGSDFSRYYGATMITPNSAEFQVVANNKVDYDDPKTIIKEGNKLRHTLGLEALLITQGDKGMTLLQDKAPELHFEAHTQEVYDVTGAGDTVIATLAFAIACGESVAIATAIANLAAGIVVKRLGATSVNLVDLRYHSQLVSGESAAILSRNDLARIVEDAKKQNRKVVFTNGCFDILHAGHIGYLEQAKKLGDLLIVAVNDDQSVRSLKGSERPINPLEYRVAVLAALSSVNFVIPFSELTPEPLLELLKPDIVVKGGDYKSREEVVGHEIVASYGGKIILLPKVADYSTTAIIENIARRKGQQSVVD